jgi:hypothetical protein
VFALPTRKDDDASASEWRIRAKQESFDQVGLGGATHLKCTPEEEHLHLSRETKEIIMSKLIALALVGFSLVASAPAAMANNRADRYWTDQSKQCGGFSCNSQAGSRAFWDYQTEHGN